ncbi:TPA: hypothetical protein ACGA4X_003556 [Acinetobacter baumannii]|nr:hypothetical protein [Acinetobacter baumannii]
MVESNLLQILVKNIGLGVIDTLAMGAGSTIKNSVAEVQNHTKQTSDAIYYLQVKTFLETAELDQDEINRFFQGNPDNQRLGAEIFKILEQTYIEKQSQMMARAFSLYVLKKIEKHTLDQLTYIITNLNQHLINKLEEYLPEDAITIKEFDLHYGSIGLNAIFNPNGNYTREEIAYDRKIWSFFSRKYKNVPQALINFEFYKPIDMAITMDLETFPQQEYEPTRFFLWFVTHILKDNISKK